MQEYISVNQRLHLLCQILAKVAANFVRETEDYSHTNLSLDPISNRINTRWMKNSKGSIFLGLKIDRLSYQWVNDAFEVIKEIKIEGKGFRELQPLLESTLVSVGFDQPNLPESLKYEIEAYEFRNLQFQQFHKSDVDLWVRYRSLANEACNAFLNYLNKNAEARIWPHHFDTGVYIEIGGKVGVGFGLAVKDKLASFPYYYLSGNGLAGEISLKDLPDLVYGSWKTGYWNGAILTLAELERFDPSEKTKVVNSFTKTALDWYLNCTLK